MGKRVIKSYVWYCDKCFFVSTINRESSAMVEPPAHIYAETMVWEYDWDTAERGSLIYQGGAMQGSISEHVEVCRRLVLTGDPEPTDGDGGEGA